MVVLNFLGSQLWLNAYFYNRGLNPKEISEKILDTCESILKDEHG
jgi:uncharacterized protein (DUF2164 family)